MPIDRRRFIASSIGFSLAAPALAQSYGQAFSIDNDDGRPVANMRLPGEITGELEALRGMTYLGAREPDVTLYEFFDYNCAYCRKAVGDLAAMVASDPSLRVTLVHNPMLSPTSAQAAKIVIAVQKLRGSADALRIHTALLAAPGRNDGLRALDVAAKNGLARAELEDVANSEPVRLALRSQMQAAANLGLNATPSYVLGNTGLLGHPGPKALARMVTAMRRCDRVVCG